MSHAAPVWRYGTLLRGAALANGYRHRRLGVALADRRRDLPESRRER